MIGDMLHDYMVYRASSEGRAYTLTPEDLQELYDDGARIFFGVEISEDGKLLRDVENPETFHIFTTLH